MRVVFTMIGLACSAGICLAQATEERRTDFPPAQVAAHGAVLASAPTSQGVPTAGPSNTDATQLRHAMRAKANAGLVGVVSGGIDSTDLRVANELASVLDGAAGGLRVIPVAGRGSVQNVTDILFTRGIDIGIVQADVMASLKDAPPFPGVERYLQYIAKLYDQEVHILASNSIQSVEDLAFKKVNIDVSGSGTELTSNVIFDALKIPIQAISVDQPAALERLKRGEISALVYVTGKPDRLFRDLRPEDNVHFLSIPVAPDLKETYAPAVLGREDYPGLFGPGDSVETLSVASVMAVYNWQPGTERYRNAERFVDAFFSRLQDFQEPARHPKWRSIDLAASLPGWTRFPPAERMVKRAGWNSPDAVRHARRDKTHEGGMTERLDTTEREALFKDFLAYHNEGSSAAGAGTRLGERQRDLLFTEFVAYCKAECSPVRIAALPGVPRQNVH